MEINIKEALRYIGVKGEIPDELLLQTQQIADRLQKSLRPRYVYQVFPLEKSGEDIHLIGTNVVLSGRSANIMLKECDKAALLACTVGAQFDAMLLREQARDMSRATIMDACGSAYVEAGCDVAEQELAARLPEQFLTDRFSPGYGDLPLSLQVPISAALNMEKVIGLYVTDSLLLNPVKSVTAVIGIADTPQMARIRGCAFCSLRENCALRKGGTPCGL